MRHNNSNTSGSGVKKNLSKNVIALVVGLLMIVSMATLAACNSSPQRATEPAGERHEVEDFVGMQLNEVLDSPALVTQYDAIIIEESTDEFPSGTIIRQDPAAGREVPTGANSTIPMRLYVAVATIDFAPDTESPSVDSEPSEAEPIIAWKDIEPTWYNWRLEDAQGNQTVRLTVITFPGVVGPDAPLFHPLLVHNSPDEPERWSRVIIPAYDSDTLVVPFVVMATNVRESDTAPIDMFVHLNQIGIGRNSPAQVTSAGAGGNWDWLNVATTAAEGLTSILIEDAVRLNSITFYGYLTLDLREGAVAADFGNYTIAFTAGSTGRGITRTVSFQLRDYEDTIILTVALAADLP